MLAFLLQPTVIFPELLAITVLYFIVDFILNPLRDIPGPLLARFTRLWYFFALRKGNFEVTNVQLHKKYGPIVRIAPGEYSIDDVEGAKIIYGHGNAFRKARWYWAWQVPQPEAASLFAELNPHRHSTQRRKFSAAYSMSSLVSYEPFINNCSYQMTQRFSEIAQAGRTIDLQHWLQCYAYDVIGEITFGKPFGFLDMGEDKEGVFPALEKGLKYSSLVGVFPYLHKFLFNFVPKNVGFGFIVGYTRTQIANRQRDLKTPKYSREGPPDIMTKMLVSHEENPEKMTRQDIQSICQSNVSAGSDTTSIALSSMFYNLMANPQSYRKLQDEIDTAAKEGRISDPVTFKEAQDLPYLQAVVKEALRIHSSTGFTMPRIVPLEGTTIAGRFIPGNSTVGINSWVAHRNQSVFGKDADQWRPERWHEIEEQGRGGDVEKYFFAFGQGSRTCIGKNISLLEMSKLVPQLLRRFDFVLNEKTRDEGLKNLNYWFVKQTNLNARIYFRSEKEGNPAGDNFDTT